MKLLGLLRHAKSSRDDAALDDFDRPLNERGRKAAERMGEAFKDLGLNYQRALVSPAPRAADTLALVQQHWGAELDICADARLYEASLEDLLAIIGETSPEVERLLLVGHNPALHQLALHLVSAADWPDRRSLEAKLPTGALVEVGLRINRWAALGEGGELLRFLRPRDLD